MIDKREITPELLARLTSILFTKTSFNKVLEGKISFNKISSAALADLMMEDEYFRQSYSRLECESYAQSVSDYVIKKTDWQQNRASDVSSAFNVFDLFMMTLQDLLLFDNNKIKCNYEQIFAWRILSRHLGEELALSVRYAVWDYRHEKTERTDFDWPYVTAHNNKQLNLILRRGIAEHHCHLWGSTPYFHVSWVNLMNHLTDSEYRKNFQWITPGEWKNEFLQWRYGDSADKSARKYPVDNEADSSYGIVVQFCAARIRFHLFEQLMGETSKASEDIDINNVLYSKNWHQFLLWGTKLQNELDTRAYTGSAKTDYALNMIPPEVKKVSTNYEILIGERWLYYNVFMDYCKPDREKRLSCQDYNLFFAYFLMRTQLRSQMVQNNEIIGFDNFQRIQNRKGFFTSDPISNHYLVSLAVAEPLTKPYIKELEIRITPEPNQVKQLERILNADEEQKKRYYYVFHFIKQNEKHSGMTETGMRRQYPLNRMVYRQEKVRRRFMKQAEDIIRFREREPHMARRVLGIDAASQEIGCRPEVFSTVYRRLGDHCVNYGGYYEAIQQLPALGKTYHVGEDFLDIVDGLRAIDEVIHFLNFDCGDRLGHAIVLGTNVEEWYEKKHRVISLSIQDYLDNLAWLYHALSYFVVPEVHTLKERISADFEYWFRIVYRNNMAEEELNMIMKRARQDCYDNTHEDHDLYQVHTCHFDIMDYYRAWTLRGDDPSCYAAGYFKKLSAEAFLISSESCKINEQFPAHYEDRYVAEYSLLNYFYQYDENVRSEGERRIKVDISEEYIRAVKAVQIEMRYRLARRGISIETNPTSNVLISTFRKYEKHPILAFYNRGLPVNEKEEDECAQLQVSINTDDSGVFYTDLEMEYALLARSVEQIVGEKDRPRFKKTDIYKWLDNIRMMGLEQSFQALGEE